MPQYHKNLSVQSIGSKSYYREVLISPERVLKAALSKLSLDFGLEQSAVTEM